MGLPLQPGLDHRGRFGDGDAPLFPPPETLDALGGPDTVARLVDGLYDRIEADTLLRPAFTGDLTRERENQKEFFTAWLGSFQPLFDSESRHELRLAHAHLSISSGLAERWRDHFLASLAEVTIDDAVIRAIAPSITRLALALVNRADEPARGERLRCVFGGAVMDEVRRAIRCDDAEALAALARQYARLLPMHGPELLLLATVRGRAQAAVELLHHGVYVNTPAMLTAAEAKAHGLPRLRLTPLCGALARGRAGMGRLLVEYGAQYDVFTAAFLGDTDALCALLDQAPDLADARDPACDIARITPLLQAVAGGQPHAARLLLERGATLGANSGKLLELAAIQDRAELVDTLLAAGADASQVGPGPWVAFPALAERLVARGADVNRHGGYWIWLSCTGNSGHRENLALVQGFLDCGADVSARWNGRTALHYAARAGFARVVAALLAHGADVNALSDQGRTPLDETERAAPSIPREPVRRLLEAHGARRSPSAT
jgi:truncated hemoglobin YjbI